MTLLRIHNHVWMCNMPSHVELVMNKLFPTPGDPDNWPSTEPLLPRSEDD